MNYVSRQDIFEKDRKSFSLAKKKNRSLKKRKSRDPNETVEMRVARKKRQLKKRQTRKVQKKKGAEKKQ